MFPPRHRETKGKCVVEAKGGFRGLMKIDIVDHSMYECIDCMCIF